MISIQLNLIWPGCAQGKYVVKAKECILAVVSWGAYDGVLEDWGPFAYIPIDPAGNGSFFFPGYRSIPATASYVWARCYKADFSAYEDVCVAIPERYLSVAATEENAQRFSVLTDIHFSSKPWTAKQALKAAGSDVIFLLGDSTNDGYQEQFEQFQQCIDESVPESTIFPVAGNHDILHIAKSKEQDGRVNYLGFQSYMLSQAKKRGYKGTFAPDGYAYSVMVGDIDVIALQCVISGRQFRFPDGLQLDWLEEHLAQTTASWHIVLCHAPLLQHNPNRNDSPPYLDQNKRIQQILNQNRRVIFLNGHTHASPNVLIGNVDFDREYANIYIDCGSVVATDTSGEMGLMAPEWKDGCKTELILTSQSVEICMSSIKSGIKLPRGYYHFRV